MFRVARFLAIEHANRVERELKLLRAARAIIHLNGGICELTLTILRSGLIIEFNKKVSHKLFRGKPHKPSEVPMQSRDSHQTHPNGKTTAVFQTQFPWVEIWADFWQQAEHISRNQGNVLVNWLKWVRTVAVAPFRNNQDILPGWFSFNEMKSSNPDLELAILDDVASYGSQLGTIGDCLEVMRKHMRLEVSALDKGEREALRKFNNLMLKVQEKKDDVGLTSTPRIHEDSKLKSRPRRHKTGVSASRATRSPA